MPGARPTPRSTTRCRAERPTFAVVANPTALHADLARPCIRRRLPRAPREACVAHRRRVWTRSSARSSRATHGCSWASNSASTPGLRRVGELLRSVRWARRCHGRVSGASTCPTGIPGRTGAPGTRLAATSAAASTTRSATRSTTCGCSSVIRRASAVDQRAAPARARRRRSGRHHLPSSSDGLDIDLHLDYWRRPPEHRLDLTCTDGALAWDYVAGTLRVWSAADPTGAWSTWAGSTRATTCSAPRPATSSTSSRRRRARLHDRRRAASRAHRADAVEQSSAQRSAFVDLDATGSPRRCVPHRMSARSSASRKERCSAAVGLGVVTAGRLDRDPAVVAERAERRRRLRSRRCRTRTARSCRCRPCPSRGRAARPSPRMSISRAGSKPAAGRVADVVTETDRG